MEIFIENRQGITLSDYPQDDNNRLNKVNLPINYSCKSRKSSQQGLSSKNSLNSSQTARLTITTNLWKIVMSICALNLITVISLSEGASVVVRKPSDNIDNTLISKLLKDENISATDPGTPDDMEFAHQPEVNSPLHVAQCRATCLQKFNNRLDGKISTSTLTSTTSSSPCFTHSDCFTCWKSCEVLESLAQWTATTSFNFNVPSTTTGNKGKGDDDKVGSTKRSKSLGTMCSHSGSLCLSGCQVACGFYETLMMRMNEPLSGPVVATKRENVLHISSGKIEWPVEPKGSKKDIKFLMKLAEFVNPQQQPLKETQSTLVYVLIQQYPDLQWRQIIQTTDTSVEIAKSLSAQMVNKLRNVRVLVVSPNGLVTIYYPEQQMLVEQHISDDGVLPQESSTKKNEHVVENVDSALITEMPITPDIEVESNSDVKVDESYPSIEGKTPQGEIRSLIDMLGSDQWELRRVSLIHQKSLVIAELKWNPVKYSEDQEYLITWELDGGGLKGHLVTDSTTVSLSLWPDTLYHIQVELFEREEEEEDGEQEDQDASNSKPKSKSFPLTVDTSEASYPLLEKPSALSNNFEEDGSGSNAPSTTTSAVSRGHKSVTQFLNVTLLLTISCAALLVLGSLLLALSWHNMVNQRRRCSSKDPQLLQDTDDYSSTTTSEEEDSSTKHHSSYDAPTVAIISPAQLVYPSEKVHQQWSASTNPSRNYTIPINGPNNIPCNYHPDNSSNTTSLVAPCWWQNLSTARESNNHCHVNSHHSLKPLMNCVNLAGSYFTHNSNSLPRIQK